MNGQGDADLSGLAYSTTATASSNVGGAYTATASGGTLTGAATGNYTLSYETGAFTVTPATLTVTATGTQTYGSTTPSYDFSASGWMNGQGDSNLSGLAYSTTATASSNVGGAYTATASGGTLTGAATGNYTLTYEAGAFSVTPRPILVIANNLVRFVDQPNPPLTYTIGGEGLVNGDTLAGELVTPAEISSPPGQYAILQGSVVASANYALTYLPGVLAVTQPLPPDFIETNPTDERRRTRELLVLLSLIDVYQREPAPGIFYSPQLTMKAQ
ncbi:MBG domain-containing protein, partial [Ancylobacter vacuolatus]